jgi:hypothetical protein
MSETHKNAITVVERHETKPMAPVVAAGIDLLRHSPTQSPEVFAATMEKLLAVQERHEANEARKAYAAAIVSVKSRLPSVIGYDAQNKFVGYKYATLAALVDAVTGILSEHGLSVSWDTSTPKEGAVTVVCRLTHAAGHVETSSPVTSPLENTTTAAGKEKKTPVQAIASVSTTLRRVTLMNILGISSGEETSDEAHQGAPDLSNVNTDRNMKWVAWLKKQGKSKADAEAFLDKPFEEWTAGDCEKLKTWALPAEPGASG